jgi:hypothetical protein
VISWKEFGRKQLRPILKYHTSIFWGDRRKQRKPPVSPDQELNPRQPEYESEGLTTHPLVALWLRTHLNPLWTVVHHFARSLLFGSQNNMIITCNYADIQICLWHHTVVISVLHCCLWDLGLLRSCYRCSYGIRFSTNCEPSLSPTPQPRNVRRIDMLCLLLIKLLTEFK